MGMKMNNYAVNQAEKGTVIYTENEKIDSICIILKGRVIAFNGGAKMRLGSGSFIGVSDLFMGRFLNSYIAYDDLTFYCFPILGKDGLTNIFATNKDYKGLVVASLMKNLNEADKIFSGLRTNADRLYNFIVKNYEVYIETGKKLGYPVIIIDGIQDLKQYNSDFQINERELLYYKECSNISLDVWKAYCAKGDTIALYLVENVSGLIAQLTIECIEMSAYIVETLSGLINNNEACLFKNIAILAISIEDAGGYNDELLHIIDDIVDQINVIEIFFDENVGRGLKVDRKQMEEIYYLLLSKNSDRKQQVQTQFQYTQIEIRLVNLELQNSVKQIIVYANIEKENADRLESLFLYFVNQKDKYSTESGMRDLRKKLTEEFYDLYEIVFLRAYQDKEVPKAIDLFLKYAFLDERLLTKEQWSELYYLEKETQEDIVACHVYNMKEWLVCIYEGDKEPSKNDFDLDYKDMLRDKRKKCEITLEQEKELQDDLTKKLSYEIHNMFRYNHRLVNGQISTFVPFLCGDNMKQGVSKLIVSANRVNSAVQELLEIDYSVFHREMMYVNNELGIAKEYIEKQVYPDIILMPTVGYNGVMWQEITGKRKSNEGRFLLPMFTENSLKDMLLKVFGRFHWELCRSIQGSDWNNINYKSLTSEYADYIQFYRKNKSLSEEAKGKLKLQILKGKGSNRELFVIDYENWMKGESNGSLRLNKVARELFATYCPFSRKLREKLITQPLFEDAMARFGRNNVKKIKALESRYRALVKEKVELTKELNDTLIFYSDL